MTVESIIHLSNIRAAGLEQFWPQESIHFLREFMLLWGSASILSCLIIYRLLTHPQQYYPFLKDLKFFTLFHAFLVIYISRIPYQNILPTPNTYLWISHYSSFLKLEAFILIVFTLLIYYGEHKNYLPQ